MDETVILQGARVAVDATRSSRVDLSIRGTRVVIGNGRHCAGRKLDLTGFLVLPGLINAHDHLELNLFPRLGRGPYPNATAWAEDIYRPQENPIKQQLAVPKSLRLFWGGIKNLLAGVTSVAHHNPYDSSVFERAFPVRVLKNFGWAHSIRFSPDWNHLHRSTRPGVPFIIHAAEGTDDEARNELYRLDRSGLLSKSTALVHGVALRPDDLPLLRKSGVALIWCPSSNYFTLGRTLCSDLLDSRVPIALGTDSALTGEGDLIDELRVAGRLIDAVRLYNLVTIEAAHILGFNNGEGCIRDGGVADLLVVRDGGQTPAEALLDLRPEIVFVSGQMNLISPTAASSLGCRDLSKYQTITLEGRGTRLVRFYIAQAVKRTTNVIGENMQLAGKAVLS